MSRLRQTKLVDIGHFGHNCAKNQRPATHGMIAIGAKPLSGNGHGEVNVARLAKFVAIFRAQLFAKQTIQYLMRNG